MWPIGDGLLFTGTEFIPSAPDLAFASNTSLYSRQGSDSGWARHDFAGAPGWPLAQSHAAGPLLYAVGGTFEDGSVLFRFDTAAKSLRYHIIPGGPVLRAVHCPEGGRCIAVGDQGAILGFALP